MTLRAPLSSLGSTVVTLPIGGSWTVPQGQYILNVGRFATLVRYDPISTAWLPLFDGPQDSGVATVNSDGQNLRVIHPTSFPVASGVTAGGSGYTSSPLVTPSEGKSKWTAILGQTLNSITVINGGSNYTYPPTVMIGAPPAPGYPATAIATVSNGSVTGVTMINVGAGYIQNPSFSLINDPRDNTGGGAFAVPTLGNSGAVTGVVCTDPFGGVSVTSGTVPTLAFSGGGGSGASATALMCWTVTTITASTAGAGYDASVPVGVTTVGDGMPTLSPAYSNARFEGNFALLRARPARGWYTTSSSGGFSGAATISDFGIVVGKATNLAVKAISNAAATTAAAFTFAVGGQVDVIYVVAN